MNLHRLASRVAARHLKAQFPGQSQGQGQKGQGGNPAATAVSGNMNDPVTSAVNKAFDQVLAVRDKVEASGDEGLYANPIPVGNGETLFPGQGLEEMSWAIEFDGNEENFVVNLTSQFKHDVDPQVCEFSVQACEDQREEFLKIVSDALKADAEGGKGQAGDQEPA